MAVTDGQFEGVETAEQLSLESASAGTRRGSPVRPRSTWGRSLTLSAAQPAPVTSISGRRKPLTAQHRRPWRRQLLDLGRYLPHGRTASSRSKIHQTLTTRRSRLRQGSEDGGGAGRRTIREGLDSLGLPPLLQVERKLSVSLGEPHVVRSPMLGALVSPRLNRPFHGKRDSEPAASFLVAHRDGAAVGIDQAPGNGEPKT